MSRGSCLFRDIFRDGIAPPKWLWWEALRQASSHPRNLSTSKTAAAEGKKSGSEGQGCNSRAPEAEWFCISLRRREINLRCLRIDALRWGDLLDQGEEGSVGPGSPQPAAPSPQHPEVNGGQHPQAEVAGVVSLALWWLVEWRTEEFFPDVGRARMQ